MQPAERKAYWNFREQKFRITKKAKLNHPERWGSRNTKWYEVRKVEVLNPDERKSA